MKQRDRFAAQILNPGSRIYTSREEWSLEIIRDPRPSCLSKWAVRNELRSMFPGETHYINGVQVYKCMRNHSEARYVVAGGKMTTFDGAIEALERARKVA